MHFIPRSINVRGRQFDSRPRDCEPCGFDVLHVQTLASSLSARPASLEKKGDIGAEGLRDRVQVEVELVGCDESPESGGCVGASTTQTCTWRDALVEVKAGRHLAARSLLHRSVRSE